MQKSATNILVAINVGIFVLTIASLRSLVPLFGFTPLATLDGAFWQPLTSMFMHGSIAHILFNMLALWSLGNPIERDIGTKPFLKLYFISGLGGVILITIFQFNTSMPTVGASGAIAGLLGALAIFYPNARLLVLFIPMKARTAAILFIAASIIFSISGSMDGISHMGHLGGLLAGLAYSKFAIGGGRGRSPGRTPTGPAGDMFNDARYDQGHPGQRPVNPQDILRKFMNDFANQQNRTSDPRNNDFGRQDIEDDSGRDNQKSEDNMNVDVSRPKKLHYNPQTGEYFYK